MFEILFLLAIVGAIGWGLRGFILLAQMLVRPTPRDFVKDLRGELTYSGSEFALARCAQYPHWPFATVCSELIEAPSAEIATRYEKATTDILRSAVVTEREQLGTMSVSVLYAFGFLIWTACAVSTEGVPYGSCKLALFCFCLGSFVVVPHLIALVSLVVKRPSTQDEVRSLKDLVTEL